MIDSRCTSNPLLCLDNARILPWLCSGASSRGVPPGRPSRAFPVAPSQSCCLEINSTCGPGANELPAPEVSCLGLDTAEGSEGLRNPKRVRARSTVLLKTPLPRAGRPRSPRSSAPGRSARRETGLLRGTSPRRAPRGEGRGPCGPGPVAEGSPGGQGRRGGHAETSGGLGKASGESLAGRPRVRLRSFRGNGQVPRTGGGFSGRGKGTSIAFYRRVACGLSASRSPSSTPAPTRGSGRGRAFPPRRAARGGRPRARGTRG